MSSKLRYLTAVFILYLQEGNQLSPEIVSTARKTAEKVLDELPIWMQLLEPYHKDYEEFAKKGHLHPFVVDCENHYRIFGAWALTLAGATPKLTMNLSFQAGTFLAYFSEVEDTDAIFDERPGIYLTEHFVYIQDCNLPFSGKISELFATAKMGGLDI